MEIDGFTGGLCQQGCNNTCLNSESNLGPVV